MSPSLQIVQRLEVGQHRWDSVVEHADEAWLWHRFDFQDVLCTWPGRLDVSFAIVEERGSETVLAVVPLHLAQCRQGPLLASTVLDSFGGPACINRLHARHRRKILQMVHDHLMTLHYRHKTVEIALSLPPMAPALRGDRCPRVNPLLELGCVNSLTQTWVIHLEKGEQELWNNLAEGTRENIRKATRTGVEVYEAEPDGDVDAVDVYYELHLDTCRRTGVHPHPKKYFDAIWNGCLRGGLCHVLFAKHAGKTVAALNLGTYKKGAFYWTGASRKEALAVGANALLHWRGIQWMLQEGFECYDVGEAFPNLATGKHRTISDFKRNFGGMLYPFYRGHFDKRTRTRRILKFLRDQFRS